jgi:predicted amidohydrolase YtcJ
MSHPHTSGEQAPRPPLTIFTARRIHTLDESLPEATAVAVAEGRIVAVGSLEDMAVWREGREVTVDHRFADQVLLPGLIDNHIHPFLGALLMPMEHIAPEAWKQPDGSVRPAARTPQDYRSLLLERAAAKPDHDDWFITWGYQPALHGRYDRQVLDELFPDRPVILWQRSFHETYMNTRATDKLGLTEADVAGHPQIDWARGHFFETGNKAIVMRLMPYLMRPAWYHEGLRRTAALMHMGGITTAGDMLFGSIDPAHEVAALEQVLEREGAPMRVVNVFDSRGFSNRARGIRAMGPPDQPIDFEAGLQAVQPWLSRGSAKVWYAKAVKFFADGAMFSQLMQMREPGYTDGHQGQWLMAPPVLKAGVRAFWNAGFTVHVHVNGDAGMDAVLEALELAQDEKPRFDHRFHAHHVGFHAQAQTARLAALGAHASVNPYYIHALSDDYAGFGLGPERASQITRCGSMLRAGMKVSFHSDFMMAPPEPLTLAWCAANRKTQSGRTVSPEERLTLMQALRGVTIDAAWTLRIEHEVGSIAAGKRADFCVLEDDPFELGVERLHEVRIAGTVFEGVPHPLAQPAGSSLGAAFAHGAVAQTSAGSTDAAGHAVAERTQAAADATDETDAATSSHATTGRYRPLSALRNACCGFSDRCDIVRQWSAWLGSAWSAATPPPATTLKTASPSAFSAPR